jgi:hypothetical protein
MIPLGKMEYDAHVMLDQDNDELLVAVADEPRNVVGLLVAHAAVGSSSGSRRLQCQRHHDLRRTLVAVGQLAQRISVIWKVPAIPMPTRRCAGSPVMSRPSRRICPLLGAKNPLIKLKKVVLLAPLGPITSRSRAFSRPAPRRRGA